MNETIGQIVQDGRFIVTYERQCPGYHCWDTGECVVLRDLSSIIEHWHLGRFLFRAPRTLAQCVRQAFYLIDLLRLQDVREEEALDDAKSFAQWLLSCKED